MSMTIYLLALSCLIGWVVITALALYTLYNVMEFWNSPCCKYDTRIIEALILHPVALILFITSLSIVYSGLTCMGAI